MTVPQQPDATRRIYCNRTLNLRKIRAVGYDMDYTLIHYHVEEWERTAYEHMRQKLARDGFPVEDLSFDPELVIRGLTIDRELGNVVKTNRFGYIKAAHHGTRELPYDELREAYTRVLVDLGDPRYRFLNTFFAASEACMYMQLVDLLDAGKLPGIHGYSDVYNAVRASLDAAHMEGELKAEILADPERFVDLDPKSPSPCWTRSRPA